MTITRLRYVCEVNPATPEFVRLPDDASVTFLPMEAVWPGERLDLSERRPKGAVGTGYTRFQSGDILVPKITPTFEAARSVLTPSLDTRVGAGTTELHVLRPRPQIDARYLCYLTNSIPFLKLGEAEMYGVAGQKRVPDEFVRDFVVDLPEVDEQTRIADFLDAETASIDALRSLRRRAVDRLLERREAGVHAAVTGSAVGERRPSLIAWAPTLPVGWLDGKLSLVARMGSGHTPSRSRDEWWADCTIPWITTGEVAQVRDDRAEEIHQTREMVSEVGLANSAAELCPKGTVVLCRTASAGYSAVMGSAMATSQDFVTWRCGPKVDPFYLLWCLRAMRSDLLGRLAMGSTHKTIYVPDLQMLRVPLPPISEQRGIVESIRQSNRQIDAAVDAVRRQIELLTERRQALITAAVTGQFDVTTARGVDLS